VCANAGVSANQQLTKVIGYEFNADLNDYDFSVSSQYWDERVQRAAGPARRTRPQGLMIIESSAVQGGVESGAGGRGVSHKFCDMTIYTADSGAKVVSASTFQWSWGLDDFIVNGLSDFRPRNWTREPGQANEAIKQITRNILNRFTVTQQGEGAFYQPDGQGGITWRGGEIGWRSTWRTIVPGTFSTDGSTDLLFYDPIRGEGEFYQPNGQGGMTRIGSTQTGWRSTWRMIIPGKFSDGPYTDLLFYDPLRGEGEFYQPDGQGGMTRIGSTQTGWSPYWHTIVPGNFSGGPYTDLLFYTPLDNTTVDYQWSGQKSGGDSAISSQFVIAGMIFHPSRVKSELLHK
jgi:hypothetical protein